MSRDLSQIHKLKEDILAGNTTYSDVERRLSAAIEAEYDREDANIDFINACEDLLLEMRTDGELPSFPTAEEYAIEMQKHMPVKKERSFLPKLAWRCAAVLAAMLVIVLLGDHVFHWQWFTGISTEDEQQYVIQGHEITVSMIAESIAEHAIGEMLQTEDWNEIVRFVGFDLTVPTAESVNAESVTYYAFFDSNRISLTAQYTIDSDQSKYLVCSLDLFNNMDDAYTMFEQSAIGTSMNIQGHQVYSSKNYDQLFFTWNQGNMMYQLMGTIDESIGHKIVQTIIGGKK